MTRKANILPPCELTGLRNACMECKRLKANSITGPNTCTKWFAVKYLLNKNISIYMTLKGGRGSMGGNNNHAVDWCIYFMLPVRAINEV